MKAVFENLAVFRNLHPAFSHLQAEEMLKGNSAPFHAGALRYYKEKGLL
ncbi:MAG: TAXI family TRAP transporter solute-binding subunit [Candidatus Thiodiazotropha endolucinida]